MESRHIRLTVQNRVQGSDLFAGTWRSMGVSCGQPKDRVVHVSLKSIAERSRIPDGGRSTQRSYFSPTARISHGPMTVS
jgi:hypothetical protein